LNFIYNHDINGGISNRSKYRMNAPKITLFA
jgi:hypothetical protein